MAAQLCEPNYQAGFEQRCPEMLGSAPCFGNMAGIDFKNGRTCPIIMVSAQDTSDWSIQGIWDNTADLVCLSLH